MVTKAATGYHIHPLSVLHYLGVAELAEHLPSWPVQQLYKKLSSTHPRNLLACLRKNTMEEYLLVLSEEHHAALPAEDGVGKNLENKGLRSGMSPTPFSCATPLQILCLQHNNNIEEHNLSIHLNNTMSNNVLSPESKWIQPLVLRANSTKRLCTQKQCM